MLTLVEQTLIGPNIDNSFEASIATILGVQLDAVPRLWTGKHPRFSEMSDPEAWKPQENYLRLYRWLETEHNVKLVGFETPRLLSVSDTMKLMNPQWLPASFNTSILVGLDYNWNTHSVVCTKIGADPKMSSYSHEILDPAFEYYKHNLGLLGLRLVKWVYWLLPLQYIPAEMQELPCVLIQEE